MAAHPTKRRGAFRPALAGLALALALTPVAPRAQTDIEARLARVERLLDGGVLVQMLENLEALRNEVQALRGEIEVQTNAAAQLKSRQRELYLGLDERLLRVERAGSALVAAEAPPGTEVPPPASAEPASTLQGEADVAELPSIVLPSTEVSVAAEPVAPTDGGAATNASETIVASVVPEDDADPLAPLVEVDPVREQQDYQTAFSFLKGGRYHDAAKAFRTFLITYPGSDFVDNARYWLGETYYVTRQFEAAMQEFQELILRFPQSPKLTHAKLKVGYIHHELGRSEQAKQALLELVESHPDSTAAGLARKRLKRLQSS